LKNIDSPDPASKLDMKPKLIGEILNIVTDKFKTEFAKNTCFNKCVLALYKEHAEKIFTRSLFEFMGYIFLSCSAILLQDSGNEQMSSLASVFSLAPLLHLAWMYEATQYKYLGKNYFSADNVNDVILVIN